MDSFDKAQTFNTISMAIQYGYINATRYLYFDALECTQKNMNDELVFVEAKGDKQ